jgi:hypothetical protein
MTRHECERGDHAACSGEGRTPRLHVVPVDLDEANAFVRRVHRHHPPVVGHRWSTAAADESGTVRGVAIIGRPVARSLDDGWTLEVTRLATDGCPNACSFLYEAAWRQARERGFLRLGTYILASEPGTSLVAAGWRRIAEVKGRSWDCASRPRIDKHPTQDKLRFEIGAPRRVGT